MKEVFKLNKSFANSSPHLVETHMSVFLECCHLSLPLYPSNYQTLFWHGPEASVSPVAHGGEA